MPKLSYSILTDEQLANLSNNKEIELNDQQLENLSDSDLEAMANNEPIEFMDDVSQAESVEDIVGGPDEESLYQAMEQMAPQIESDLQASAAGIAGLGTALSGNIGNEAILPGLQTAGNVLSGKTSIQDIAVDFNHPYLTPFLNQISIVTKQKCVTF